MTRFFPVTIILLSVGACLTYLFKGDYARAVYWGAGSLLTLSTLFIH